MRKKEKEKYSVFLERLLKIFYLFDITLSVTLTLVSGFVFEIQTRSATSSSNECGSIRIRKLA
jgi:hypothetical protein